MSSNLDGPFGFARGGRTENCDESVGHGVKVGKGLRDLKGSGRERTEGLKWEECICSQGFVVLREWFDFKELYAGGLMPDSGSVFYFAPLGCIAEKDRC